MEANEARKHEERWSKRNKSKNNKHYLFELSFWMNENQYEPHSTRLETHVQLVFENLKNKSRNLTITNWESSPRKQRKIRL